MNTPIPVPEPVVALEARYEPAPGIPVDDARTFLRWAGSRYGRTGGRFKDFQLLAIVAADEDEKEFLRGRYPGLVAAVEMYRKDIYWLEKLEESVRAAEVSA